MTDLLKDTRTDTEKIKIYMKNLDLTESQAQELLNYDKQIDKMISVKQCESDLTDSQKKTIKKYKNATKTVNAYGKQVTRVRKEDMTKRLIIDNISNLLQSIGNDVQVTNAEKEILFTVNEKKYKIVLSAPRK